MQDHLLDLCNFDKLTLIVKCEHVSSTSRIHRKRQHNMHLVHHRRPLLLNLLVSLFLHFVRIHSWSASVRHLTIHIFLIHVIHAVVVGDDTHLLLLIHDVHVCWHLLSMHYICLNWLIYTLSIASKDLLILHVYRILMHEIVAMVIRF